MNRRAFLASGSALLTAGCLDLTVSPAGTPTDSGSDRRESDGFSATVLGIRDHYELSRSQPTDEDGDFRPAVDGTVDCAVGTVTLEGWFATSSCRTIEILSLAHDAESDRLTVALVDAWNAASEPDEVDCAGITYRYRIRIETADATPDGEPGSAIPATVRVVHRSRLDEASETLDVETDGC